MADQQGINLNASIKELLKLIGNKMTNKYTIKDLDLDKLYHEYDDLKYRAYPSHILYLMNQAYEEGVKNSGCNNSFECADRININLYGLKKENELNKEIIKDLKQVIAAQKEAIDSFKQENEKLKRESDSDRGAFLQARSDDYLEIVKLTKENEELKKQKIVYQEARAYVSKKFTISEKENEELKNQVILLSEEIQKLQKERDDLRKNIKHIIADRT